MRRPLRENRKDQEIERLEAERVIDRRPVRQPRPPIRLLHPHVTIV
jgi:hypothetical protein